jgi:hypothetical protein
MITREDLAGKNQKEIEALLDTDMQAYVVEVSEMTDLDTLSEKEKDLMLLMDENDARLKTVEYDIADSCTFDNQTFNRKTVADYIADFVSSMEVEWNYALGMYELSKLWKSKDLKKIQYGAYDSTLRILGQCKFKGFENHKKIMVVNSLLSTSHDEYVRDTSYMIYLNSLHNALLDAMDKIKKASAEPEQAETDAE